MLDKYFLFKHIFFKILKYNSFLIKINSLYKDYITIYRRNVLINLYKKRVDLSEISYSRTKIITNFKLGIKNQINFDTSDKLRVFWVGTDESQDYSGFLQALNKLFYVVNFTNSDGTYGLKKNSGINSPDSIKKLSEVNGNELIEQLDRQINYFGNFDLLIGQMLGNNISNSSLDYVKSKGIKIINISMDDRLPELWGKCGEIRLGSIGLGPQLDLVLTTSPETCEWYAVEGCPAIYWPLGSDYNIFGSDNLYDRDIDVLFIGNRYGVRGELVNYLMKNNINVECYGSGWPNGYADVEKMRDISKRAKIILGIGTIGHCKNLYTLKLRDFDGPMSGAMYLTHRNKDLCELYIEGLEIECYSTFQEAKNKILYYLNNEKERLFIAKNGQTKVLNFYTWDKRLKDTFFELGFLDK